MLEQNNAKIQEEKYQMLAEKIAIKEAITRALHFMSGLAQEEP
jgi:hypothetical protein